MAEVAAPRELFRDTEEPSSNRTKNNNGKEKSLVGLQPRFQYRPKKRKNSKNSTHTGNPGSIMSRRTLMETLGLGAVTFPDGAQALADATVSSPAPVMMTSASFGLGCSPVPSLRL
jgi:hypothetical protein